LGNPIRTLDDGIGNIYGDALQYPTTSQNTRPAASLVQTCNPLIINSSAAMGSRTSLTNYLRPETIDAFLTLPERLAGHVVVEAEEEIERVLQRADAIVAAAGNNGSDHRSDAEPAESLDLPGDQVAGLMRRLDRLEANISRDARLINEALRLLTDGAAIHDRRNGGGFGGVPASAAAIAKLERHEYGSTGLVRTKRRRGGAGDGEACGVCLENLAVGDALMVMPCEHRFHEGCLVRWLALSGVCPCCRHALPREEDEAADEHVSSNAVSTPSTTREADDANRGSQVPLAIEGPPRRSNRARRANVRLSGPEWASGGD
jgi:hypothetical protein